MTGFKKVAAPKEASLVSPDGYRVDAERGVVYGKWGRPIRRLNIRGYTEVKNQNWSRRVHRMIWETVHGPIPNGMQINHINGIKTDNRIANIELATPSENSKHAYDIGLSNAAGEKNGRSLLCEKDVIHIRASTSSRKHLAEQFGVSKRTISDVINRKNWSHVA